MVSRVPLGWPGAPNRRETSTVRKFDDTLVAYTDSLPSTEGLCERLHDLHRPDQAQTSLIRNKMRRMLSNQNFYLILTKEHIMETIDSLEQRHEFTGGQQVQSQYDPTQVKTLDANALADFRNFLDSNRDGLKTGMGAFHTDNHSNW